MDLKIDEGKLKEVLEVYKTEFSLVEWGEERYKWEALQYFHDHVYNNGWIVSSEEFGRELQIACRICNNLFSMASVGGAMIQEVYAPKDPDAVQEMLTNLYDESITLAERIQTFEAKAAKLQKKYGKPGQKDGADLRNISVFLWLNRPDKYYAYRQTELKNTAKFLNYPLLAVNQTGKKGETLKEKSIREALILEECNKFYTQLTDFVRKDSDLLSMLQKKLDDKPGYYKDAQAEILGKDVGFYLDSYYLNHKRKSEYNFFPTDFEETLSEKEWKNLLSNETIFTKDSRFILKCMEDYGESATCSDLAAEYGKTADYYSSEIENLIKRLKEYGCHPYVDSVSGKEYPWAILFKGKGKSQDFSENMSLRLHNHLRTAIKYKNDDNWNVAESHLYWCVLLDANQAADIQAGKNVEFSTDKPGNSEEGYNFKIIKEGNPVIGYDKTTKSLITLGIVKRVLDEKHFVFQKTGNMDVSKNDFKDVLSDKSKRLINGEKVILMQLSPMEYSQISNQQKCWIFTWNKENFAWNSPEDGYKALIEKLKHHKDANAQWTCGGTKKIKPGDRFFLIKLGSSLIDEERGIVASGTIESKPYEGKHWSGDPTKTAQWVKVLFDKILDPDSDKILNLIRLKEIDSNGSVNWTPISAGIEIKDKVVLKSVEKEWTKYPILPHIETGGYNRILYGVPGCGKSYNIQKEIENHQATERTIRTVFYPEYTYGDFVGQIVPKIKENGLTYEFVPGPFTRSLQLANNHRDKLCYLVIEEINRGNAAAILGDIFQLLDRFDEEDDEVISERALKGESRYPIINENIAKAVYGVESHKVTIPSNLVILASMNTSDQNVFTLDNAFQRRWQMDMIKNDFKDPKSADQLNRCVPGTDVTWGNFALVINSHISDSHDDFVSSEDKRLGVYFAQGIDFKNKERFAEKVLRYLWEDAMKMKRKAFFTAGLKTFEDVVNKFETGGLQAIFADNIFNEFEHTPINTPDETAPMQDPLEEVPLANEE